MSAPREEDDRAGPENVVRFTPAGLERLNQLADALVASVRDGQSDSVYDVLNNVLNANLDDLCRQIE